MPRDQFEVVVVDDGGGRLENLASAGAPGLQVRMIAQQHAGPATARNTGATHARGAYLCFVDDDCRPAPNWLSRLESHFTRDPLTGIGGYVINELAGDPYSQASQELLEFLYEYYNRPSGEGRFFTTNNLALPRDRFLEMGGFDTSFPLAAAEDRDLCDRWLEQGWRLTYHEDVVVRHAHAMNLFGFIRQHYTYGRGALYLHSARTRRGADLPRLESLRFYRRLLLHPLRGGHGLKAPLMIFLAGLTQAAYAAGYFRERFGGRAPTTTVELAVRGASSSREGAKRPTRTGRKDKRGAGV